MDANDIIDALGGTSTVAKLCQVKTPSVSEWRRCGIPAARLQYLRLLRPEIFAGLLAANDDTAPAEGGSPLEGSA
jgi:hypothetical protein